MQKLDLLVERHLFNHQVRPLIRGQALVLPGPLRLVLLRARLTLTQTAGKQTKHDRRTKRRSFHPSDTHVQSLSRKIRYLLRKSGRSGYVFRSFSARGQHQALARIAGTSVVRANWARVVGVVVSGVRGSA